MVPALKQLGNLAVHGIRGTGRGQANSPGLGQRRRRRLPIRAGGGRRDGRT